MIQTRLPHVFGALAKRFAGPATEQRDVDVALLDMEHGVYIAERQADVWKSLRQASPGALAASVAC